MLYLGDASPSVVFFLFEIAGGAWATLNAHYRWVGPCGRRFGALRHLQLLEHKP
jgi:hypothetical protein